MKKLSLLSLIITLMIFTQCGSDDSPSGGDIIDDITPVSLDFSDSEVTLDEADGSLSITVSLGDLAPVEGTFDIAIGGTATYGEDYTTTPAAVEDTVSISVVVGDGSKELTITLEDDTELELDETITLDISSDIDELELGDNTTVTITLTSNDQALVAIERASGEMYIVDLEDGSRTDVLTITGVTSTEFVDEIKQEESNANIRSFIYDPATETSYVGQNYNGGSKIYTVDLTDGAATQIFGNDEEDFGVEGILDFHLDGETLYGASYYSEFSGPLDEKIFIEGTSGHSYYEIDKTSGAISDVVVLDSDYAGGGALFVDSENDMVYYTNRWYSDSEERQEEITSGSALVAYDLTEESEVGTVWSSDDVADFESDSETFSITEVAVQTFAVSDDGGVYAIVSTSSQGEGGAWFLATVDMENAKLGYVTMLTDQNSSQVQAIGFLPEEVVVPLLSEE